MSVGRRKGWSRVAVLLGGQAHQVRVGALLQGFAQGLAALAPKIGELVGTAETANAFESVVVSLALGMIMSTGPTVII
jgi:hypothetical protein